MPGPKVVKVNGPITLDFGNGMRFQLVREAAVSVASSGARRGRKPSPATQALVQAFAGDIAAGNVRARTEYLAILRNAGHKGSDASAGVIINREAKRVFGKPLGRGGKARANGKGKQGNPASSMTTLLRDRLQADKAAGALRDAAHYTRWLVDKSNIGLKRVRPVVYRELRAVRDP